MAGFRSVLIPVVSIVLNLLSVAAAYGLITLIFQDGRLQGLLGYSSFGAVLIDATVVRGVLLPAALSLLGDSAWRLPGG